MSDAENDHVLRRKAQSAGSRPGGSTLSLHRVFRTAVSRAAQQLAELEAALSGFQMAEATVDGFASELDENHLLYRLRGPGDVSALAVVDPQVLAGVIEHLTTGRVVPNPAEPRVPTRTDAAMFCDFLDRVLALIDAELADLADAPRIAGYRHDMTFADARAATMGLEEVPYHWLRLAISLGGEAKSGELWLCMPVNPDTGQRTDATGKPWRIAWPENVLQVQAQVEGILCRQQMTLDDVLDLKVGDTIPVPVAALGAVEIRGGDGVVVGHGKLGQTGGHRALRIQAEIQDEVPASPIFVPPAPRARPPAADVDVMATPAPEPTSPGPEGAQTNTRETV